MFFPYGTDAPVYHWPFTTVVVIAANVLVFCTLVANPESVDSLVLVHGDGLHPAQWVTSNFVHGGVMHLVGNMLCLWAFGLVVEGKLGWYKTLAVLLGIGVTQCAVEQFLMLGAAGGGSFGASAICFGLMAMSLIWAPENHMQCVFFVFMRPFQFDMKVSVFVALMLAMEAVVAILTQLALTSAVLHLMGAAVGFAVATVLLKLDLVDCEYWDLFSVAHGYHKMAPEERHAAMQQTGSNQERQKQKQRDRRYMALEEIRKILDSGQAALAAKAHLRMTQQLPDWKLPQTDLLRLIQSLHEKKLWAESVPLMVEYLRQYTEKAVLMRLRLAQILVVHEKRPAQALRVMNTIDAAALEARHRDLLDKLRAQAQQLHEEDPYEMVEEA